VTRSNYIRLKWGTLKAWHVDSPRSQELIGKYLELGASISCMTQEDTPEQKAILCELVAQHEGTITNDWDGAAYTKEQAIDYITNFGKSEEKG
jgi:hypothetical protein